MIGSFWNLCRACPSMPVDKLHSEYRSTYRWHEYTGNPRPEVVRKPPVLNHFGPINEPPLPRRKKCPELAYKTHEFIGVSDTTSNTIVTRARSEERGVPSRRSKSEGPSDVADVMIYKNEIANGFRESSKQAGESNGLFKKTISKLSTEYRLQFVWPQVRRAIKGPGPTNDNATDYPRKSLSMNAIKSSHSNVMPTVHKKRTTKEKEATLFELEPLVNGIETTGKKSARQTDATDGEKMTSSNSQNFERERPNQFITKKENFGFCDSTTLEDKNIVNNMGYSDEWYKEVMELRKKADEYKCRGWGIEINPDLYKKQKELWDQVSKRSSLSALSLASSVHRPISKEEKDKENNKKSTFQIKPFSKVKVPGHIYPVENKVMPDGRILPVRVQTIRHHLERTTGPDVEEGALLPSPTREKLMPAIPKEKDIDSYSSQKSSPKKKDSSRHGSPQKSSPQKGSPKKIAKGPTVADSSESPKRKIRSVSTAPAPLKTAKSVTSATDKQSKSFDKESEDKDVVVSFKNNTAQIVNETAKQIVKSPPEPTRVKSPEQILMRSPDPVNWTVPLDTGKTFTVTQNVKDGEFYNRPQSEAKASTPVERPPPAPQSAPPELTEQSKMEENDYTTSLY